MAATFTAQYATARAAATAARKAVDTAVRRSEVSAEFHAVAIERDPAGYAKCLHGIADIIATLPALRATAAEADAVVAVLAERACWHCSGTGRYDGPTNATRRGVPYCFRCDGSGENAASRKARASA